MCDEDMAHLKRALENEIAYNEQERATIATNI